MCPDHTIASLCSEQHGVASRRQLTERGVYRQHLRSRLGRGQLEVVTPRVVRLGGSTPTDGQKLMTSVLHVGAGALISHHTAAAWWGLPGFALEPVTVTVVRTRRVIEDGFCVVRHATNVPDAHIRVFRGLPVASPALTLFQLAVDLPEHRLAIAVDRAWSMKLTSGPQLNSLLEQMAKSGRNGIVAMRGILEERGQNYVPPQSGLEMRALEILHRAGFEPRVQVDVGNRDEWTGRVDFLLEEWNLVVEVQSERFHTALSDIEHDRARRLRLERSGFTVVEVWDSDVFHRPLDVVQTIRNVVYAGIQSPRNLVLARSADSESPLTS